jgi:hypothetical protein
MEGGTDKDRERERNDRDKEKIGLAVRAAAGGGTSARRVRVKHLLDSTDQVIGWKVWTCSTSNFRRVTSLSTTCFSHSTRR